MLYYFIEAPPCTYSLAFVRYVLATSLVAKPIGMGWILGESGYHLEPVIDL